MKIVITENYDEMSKKGANEVAQVIKDNPAAVLGLATGSTPIGMYTELANMVKRGEISFSKVHTVNLDEYAGLGEESDQSYVYFMRHNLFDKVDLPAGAYHLPNGKAADYEAECVNYTVLLQSMPQDIQVLGLGSNGHIGFNEPNTPFTSHTHVVALTENTIKDNSRLFARMEDVPHYALTMGIADIMQAKKILLLASGENKAKAVFAALKGEVSEACPASILQRHRDVVVVLDKEAASLL
jgi:glucosamine-6-phosphate deaminase